LIDEANREIAKRQARIQELKQELEAAKMEYEEFKEQKAECERKIAEL